jgi:hypothetical protein
LTAPRGAPPCSDQVQAHKTRTIQLRSFGRSPPLITIPDVANVTISGVHQQAFASAITWKGSNAISASGSQVRMVPA